MWRVYFIFSLSSGNSLLKYLKVMQFEDNYLIQTYYFKKVEFFWQKKTKHVIFVYYFWANSVYLGEHSNEHLVPVIVCLVWTYQPFSVDTTVGLGPESIWKSLNK